MAERPDCVRASLRWVYSWGLRRCLGEASGNDPEVWRKACPGTDPRGNPWASPPNGIFISTSFYGRKSTVGFRLTPQIRRDWSRTLSVRLFRLYRPVCKCNASARKFRTMFSNSFIRDEFRNLKGIAMTRFLAISSLSLGLVATTPAIANENLLDQLSQYVPDSGLALLDRHEILDAFSISTSRDTDVQKATRIEHIATSGGHAQDLFASATRPFSRIPFARSNVANDRT